MIDRFHEEKRNFLRMSIETQVTYTIKGEPNVSHHGISQNFSATGLYMITDFSPGVGNEIEFIMNPNGDRLPPFIAKGNVIYCEADENNIHQFHVKIELLQDQ